MPIYKFIEDGHRHEIDGQQIPGNTSVLHAEGFIDDWWWNEWACDKGTKVHKASLYIDRGTLDWGTVDPRIEGYLRAYESFKKATELEIIQAEMPVCSFIYRFGTIPDRLVLMNGHLCLIDLKTGKLEPWVQLQVAAQEIALKEHYLEYKDTPIKRFGLELRENGKFSLSPEYKDRQDRAIFLSALACHNWKLNHRR